MLDLKPILDLHGKKIIAQAKRNLSNNKRGRFRRINASKRLYNSVKQKATSKEIGFWFEEYGITVDRGVTGTKGKAMPGNYASEFNPRGRQTRRPPVNRIAAWMRHKGVGTGSEGGDKKLAYNIAEKIKREGLQPKLWFSDSIKTRTPALRKAIDEAISKEIDKKLEDGSNTV